VSDTRPFARLRGSISLNGVRTIVLLVAAALSVSGYVYSYFRTARMPTHGELLTVVRDARQTPVSDAQIEVLTLDHEALVTSFAAAAAPGGPRILKEGTYRLRVTHPKYLTETRMVQVIAGHTSEVRLKLAPRVVTPPRPRVRARPPARPAPERPAATSPLDDARRVVSEGVDSLKRIFGK
jgi:hypothetical protein